MNNLYKRALKWPLKAVYGILIAFFGAFMIPYVKVKPVLAGSGGEEYTDPLGNMLDTNVSPKAFVYNNFFIDMKQFTMEKRPMDSLRVSYATGHSDTKDKINDKDLVIWTESFESLKIGYAVIVKSRHAPKFYAMKRIMDVKENGIFTLASRNEEGVLSQDDYERDKIIGRVLASVPYNKKYSPTAEPGYFSKDIRTIYKWGSPAS